MKEGVIDSAGAGPFGDFNNDRPILFQVEKGQRIDRVGISSQENRVGIHQVVEDDHMVGIGRAQFGLTTPQTLNRRRRHAVEKCLHASHKVEIVVN